MVRMHALVAASSDGEAVPSVGVGRGRTQGKKKTPDMVCTIAARYGAHT